ncbi:MAG: DUF2996 domain-containing protein [Chroococcales cyanobacterium]
MAEENKEQEKAPKPTAEDKAAKAQAAKAKAAEAKAAKPKKEKPPAPEDKPFPEFIEQEFTPALKKAFAEQGVEDIELNFVTAPIAIAGANTNEQYPQVTGKWNQGQRQFNIYFLEEDIKGKKAFSYTATGGKPSTIESFMIDERRVTLDLLVLYTMQRLNGQKWLVRN